MNHLSRRVTLLAVAGLVFAGSSQASPLSLRIRGGLSISSMSGHVLENLGVESKRGFAGGVELVVPVGGAFAIEPGVGYANRGWSYGKSESTDEAGALSGTFEALQPIDYVVASVCARVALPAMGPVRLSLLAGPYLAFETSERFKADSPEFAVDAGTDQLENRDYGGVVGAALGFAAGRGTLSIDGRYAFGLPKLIRDPDTTFGPFDLRTSAFEVGLAYTVPIGR